MLAKFLTWLLARLSPDPERFSLTQETTMTMLNTLHNTPAVHNYLDAQETYLKAEIVVAALDGKQFRKEFVAGRLHEVQAFRQKLRAAHGHIINKREALAREAKKPLA